MKRLIALTSLLLSFLALPVIAEVWDSPHKYYDKSKQKWVIYIPTSSGNVTKEKDEEIQVSSNECGWITFGIGGTTRPITSIVFGFDGIERFNTHANAPSKPKCIKKSDGTYESDYAGSSGTLLKTSVSYHFKIAPNDVVLVQLKRRVPLFRKGTQCGFIMFGVSDKRKLTTFKVGETNYNFADLVEVKHPRICYRGINNEWVTYTPDNY
jgi:hypothetical protein